MPEGIRSIQITGDTAYGLREQCHCAQVPRSRSLDRLLQTRQQRPDYVVQPRLTQWTDRSPSVLYTYNVRVKDDFLRALSLSLYSLHHPEQLAIS